MKPSYSLARKTTARATSSATPPRPSGMPAIVARAVVYFASEYDGFITGATLDINGGVYAC